MLVTPRPAPAWHVVRWLGTDEPLTLERLRGRVVVLHAFQMLCPGCVLRGIPQAQRVAELFAGAPVQVVGLHTVFEHHDVMGPDALAAFLHEYRVHFPVGIDAPGDNGDPIPRTMRAYGLRGTPSTVVIDAAGAIRWEHFGVHDDLVLGAAIGALVADMGGHLASASFREQHGGVPCEDGCVPSPPR